MFALGSANLAIAAHAYIEHPAQFPMIGVVLDDFQQGRVLANDLHQPSQFYAEHAFGFAQVFGTSDPDFEKALMHHLTVTRDFPCEKVRLFTPGLGAPLTAATFDKYRAERQHFRYDVKCARQADPISAGYEIVDIDESHLRALDAAFGITTRFWKTEAGFVRHGSGVVALQGSDVVALCYAAGVAGGEAEIDVMTVPEHRKQGLARACVDRFVARCLTVSITPLWDCFTNNAGSMALCRAAGFRPIDDPYAFYTIPRRIEA